MMIIQLILSVFLGSLSLPAVAAGRCCNNPTIWTFKNLDKSPVKLNCSLERSVAWAGKPIIMETEIIKPGSSFKYTWDPNWYSDGMGMLPGAWSCKPSDPKLAKEIKPVKFSTDWGENVTVSWRKERFAVSRRR